MGESYLIEHPVFTYNTLNLSIADLIQKVFPNSKVYDNPINAGKKLPRWFILYRNNRKFEPEVNNTALKEITLDIVYEQDYNLINLYDDYKEKAEKIEEEIHKNLTYNISEEVEGKRQIIKKIPLDAHEIETYWDQAGMHCYFTLKLRIIDEEVFKEYYIKTIDWLVKEKENE